MSVESIRGFCLSFPYATEKLQWGEVLCFKVGGKIFALLSLSSVPPRLMFKCEPEKFAELVEHGRHHSSALPGPLQVGSARTPGCPALERHHRPDYRVV